MSPELRAAIENAYAVFGAFGNPGGALTVCHCPSCMSEKTKAQLVATPLREIEAPLLAEYTNSAHGWSDQIRYFLPRYFELIAAGDPPHHSRTIVYLTRLRDGDWREAWPQAELASVDAFFDAMVRAAIADVGTDAGHDLEDVLLMIADAGGDLERALAVWDAAPDPHAAAAMALLRWRITWRGDVAIMADWIDTSMGAAAQRQGELIAAFLKRPHVDKRIEAAFFATKDPNLQAILSNGLP